MTVAALVLAALLAVAAVLFAARPFLLAHGAADAKPGLDETEVERLRLLEERDRALGALKELEFDHRTGKVTDEDYREAIGRLRQEAAEAVRAIDAFDADQNVDAPSGEERPRPVSRRS